MNYQEYYQELGRLLYAIAKVDGKIHQKEVDSLKRIVKVELVRLIDSTDEYETAAAFITEFEFEIMQDRAIPADEAFESFREYVRGNSGLSPKYKTLAYRAALKVADSFHGTNLREAELIHELKDLLREEVRVNVR